MWKGNGGKRGVRGRAREKDCREAMISSFPPSLPPSLHPSQLPNTPAGRVSDSFRAAHGLLIVHVWMLHKRLLMEGEEGKILEEALFDRLWYVPAI